MPMPHVHGGESGLAAAPPLVLMWMGMMAAMMAPTAWPWVRGFHRFHAGPSRARAIGTAQFVLGYLAVWGAYALAVTALQLILAAIGTVDPMSGMRSSAAAAPVLALAGLYQLTPLKRACLTHCRTPFGYFLTRWRSGGPAAFGIGFHHGLYCLGCCWALMATTVAVGMMNMWWMAALAIVTFIEQAVPFGDHLRRPLGLALLAAAAWLAVAP
jgi:predicted metal-binding membrane protein